MSFLRPGVTKNTKTKPKPVPLLFVCAHNEQVYRQRLHGKEIYLALLHMNESVNQDPCPWTLSLLSYSDMQITRLTPNCMCDLMSLSTQSHLTTCYASRNYAGRVTSEEGIGLMSGLVICKFRKSMVIHDTGCPY